jgi:hypothetical protein
MAKDKDRVTYLESLVPKEIEKKYTESFGKYAQYNGNGVYSWRGIVATDTRELFLMGVCRQEKIEFEEI